MSIRPIDMQGMVRNSTNNSMNSATTQNANNYANIQAQNKVMEEKMESLTHKTEKPAEEKKQLNKDGRNGEKYQDNRKKRQKLEEQALDKKALKQQREKSSMFDVSI